MVYTAEVVKSQATVDILMNIPFQDLPISDEIPEANITSKEEVCSNGASRTSFKGRIVVGGGGVVFISL